MNGFLWSLLSFLSGILIFISMGLWVVLPSETTLNLSTTVFSTSFLLVLLVLRRETWLPYLQHNYYRKLRSYLATVIILLGILGLVNYLSFKHPLSIDFTESKINSLSNNSKKFLNSLGKEEVSFRVYVNREQRNQVHPLLDLYNIEIKNLKLSYIDPDLDPLQLKNDGVERYGTLVIELAGRKKLINEFSEKKITKTIFELKRNREIHLLILNGQDELETEDRGPNGLSSLFQDLKQEGYFVQLADLNGLKKIDTGFSAVLILGPRKKYTKTKLSILKNYARSGGRFLLALDPEFDESKDHGLGELAKLYGVKFHNSLVLDQSSQSFGLDASIPIITNFSTIHNITKGFYGKVFFPLVQAVSKVESMESPFRVDGLVSSSEFPKSWEETDLKSVMSGKVDFNEESDKKGPIALMMASQEVRVKKMPRPRMKMIAMGSSRPLINAYYNQGQGRDLILRSLAWLIEADDSLRLEKDYSSGNKIILNQVHMSLLFYLCMIFIPLSLLLCAAWFFRRRTRG